MADQEPKGWSQPDIPTMTMAETMVWQIQNNRYPALPAHLKEWFRWSVQITREQRERHAGDLDPAWLPFLKKFDDDPNVLSVRIFHLKDLSDVISVEYQDRPEGRRYHMWRADQWNERLGEAPEPLTFY